MLPRLCGTGCSYLQKLFKNLVSCAGSVSISELGGRRVTIIENEIGRSFVAALGFSEF